MFERILVALDGSAQSRDAADLAIRFARHFDSRLTALFVIDARFIEGPAIEALAPIWSETGTRPFRAEIMEAWRERSVTELDRFEARAARAGIGAVDRREVAGLAEEAIVEAGRSADLAVMGRRGENAGFGMHSIGSTLARVLRHATHPVLVPGKDGAAAVDSSDQPADSSAAESDDVLPATVLVSCDGRDPSVRALDLAIRYCVATTAEIRLLTAGDEEADSLLEPAHGLCRDHGVRWESVRLDAEPAEAVVESIERWNVDCLFMGAFGHSRIHDLLLGSRTEEILGAVSVPTFLVR
jgi:nucleotide-binding universal stress UspA family protein